MSFRYLLMISLFSIFVSDAAEAMDPPSKKPASFDRRGRSPGIPPQPHVQTHSLSQNATLYPAHPPLQPPHHPEYPSPVGGYSSHNPVFGYPPPLSGAYGQPSFEHWHSQYQGQHLQPPVPGVASIPHGSLRLGPQPGAVSFSHLLVQRLSGRIVDVFRLVGNMAAQISNLEETQNRENRDREKKEEERVAQLEQIRAQLQQAQQMQMYQMYQMYQMQMYQMQRQAQLQPRPQYVGWQPQSAPVLSDSSSESGSSSPVVLVPIPKAAAASQSVASEQAGPLKATAVKRAAPSRAPVYKRKRMNLKYVPGAPTEECQGAASTKSYNNRHEDKDGKIWFVCQNCGRMFERKNAHTAHVNASKKKTKSEKTKSSTARSQEAASNVQPSESEEECEEEEQEESE